MLGAVLPCTDEGPSGGMAGPGAEVEAGNTGNLGGSLNEGWPSAIPASLWAVCQPNAQTFSLISKN